MAPEEALRRPEPVGIAWLKFPPKEGMRVEAPLDFADKNRASLVDLQGEGEGGLTHRVREYGHPLLPLPCYFASVSPPCL